MGVSLQDLASGWQIIHLPPIQPVNGHLCSGLQALHAGVKLGDHRLVTSWVHPKGGGVQPPGRNQEIHQHQDVKEIRTSGKGKAEGVLLQIKEL